MLGEMVVELDLVAALVTQALSSHGTTSQTETAIAELDDHDDL
jgi:hypothetical protein